MRIIPKLEEVHLNSDDIQTALKEYILKKTGRIVCGWVGVSEDPCGPEDSAWAHLEPTTVVTANRVIS